MEVVRMMKIETKCPEIGDRISFTLKTGEKVEAMAVKELINGTVFCTVDYLNKPYAMNRNGGTRGGYEASDLRKELNGTILGSFPDDIKEQLVPFGNGDILTIPSEREMFGENIYADEDEEDVMQWEPMADRRNRNALRDGDIEWGWLRNVARSTSFVRCDADGNTDYWDASSSAGVRPVFLIATCRKTREEAETCHS